MEANEQNDDEMILFVVEDEDQTKKYKTPKGSEHSVTMPIPISVKIEPIEDVGSLYCTEDVKEIFPIKVDRGESIEVKPDIEVLEEYLSEVEFLDEEFTQDDSNTVKVESNDSQKNRAPRKTHHKYLLDDEDVHLSPKNKKSKTNVVSSKNKKKKPNVVSSKNKKRKPNVSAKKSAPKQEPILEDEDYYEIEFLEDDIVSPKVPKKTPVSDEEFLEIEYLDDYPKEKKHKKPVEYKKNNLFSSLNTEDEEYLPDDENDDDDEEFKMEEHPKKTKKKTKTPSKKPPQKASRRKVPSVKVKKEEPVIRSIIAELRKKNPMFNDNKDKLVEHISILMRRRRPPQPLPNSFLLKDDNEYSCSYCDVESSTLAAAGRHYQAAHGPRYLVCYACGEDFRSTGNLYKHEKRCRAPDAEIQLRARGVFLGRKGRARPFLTKNKYIPKTPEIPEIPVEKPTKFYCPHCPAVYCRNGLLKEHMHKHTGFRPFQCQECPATYVSRHQLNKHAKKHSNEQFICDHCGKVLRMKASLVSHMDTHLPRPRFGCGQCGRRYVQRSAVKVHIMRDHMHMPPPAACPVCPKRYNRMSHVKSHMKKDHGLILMTKNTILRNLPYMKLADLEGAKIVFNSNEHQIIDLHPGEDVLIPDKVTNKTFILKSQ